MPQMSPMKWSLLVLMFQSMMMIFLALPNMKLSSNMLNFPMTINLNKINWKW